MEIHNKCLIIVGMHRSGTSYTASLLEKAGLNIGQKLMEASTGNDLGHFENKEFVDFQMDVLGQRNMHVDGWSLKTIASFKEDEALVAARIINDNASTEWGWKDPRTTLFLSAWEKLLPQANYLFVYRKPWEVVDSLFRRNTDTELIENPFSTVRNWEFYNEQILLHFNKHLENSILVDIENVMQNPSEVIRLVNEKFGFHLTTSTSNVYDETKFKNIGNKAQESFCALHIPSCLEMYDKLQRASSIAPIEGIYAVKKQPTSMIYWWYESAQVTNLRIQNQCEQDVLYREIENRNTEIQRLNVELDNRDHELVNMKNALEDLTQDRSNYMKELHWIKNSKWWKIRGFIRRFI